MNDVGRPTELTEEITTKIRGLVLKSLTYVEIQEILEIPTGTWDHWVYTNYQGFRGKLKDWQKERMIRKAETKVDVLMDSEDDRVALNAATFTLETLGKMDYSKKTETDITSGGKPIFIPSEIASKNNIETGDPHTSTVNNS